MSNLSQNFTITDAVINKKPILCAVNQAQGREVKACNRVMVNFTKIASFYEYRTIISSLLLSRCIKHSSKIRRNFWLFIRRVEFLKSCFVNNLKNQLRCLALAHAPMAEGFSMNFASTLLFVLNQVAFYWATY